MSEYHEFLFRSHRSAEHPFWVLLDVARGINDLPETAATFPLSRVTHHTSSQVHDDFLMLHGSWVVPDHLGPRRPKTYVNPASPHRRHYSDVSTRCPGCGERFTSMESLQRAHDAGCSWDDRKDAQKALRKNQLICIRQGADLYLRAKEVAPRLGYKDRRGVLKTAEHTGSTWGQLRIEKREKMIRTWKKIRGEVGASFEEIGEAFGYSTLLVRDYCRGYARGVPAVDL